MAAVQDGTNPGRAARGARQAPSTKFSGRPAAGTDPTNMPGQLPGDIFGISQSYSTGAGGTHPSTVDGPNGDPTTEQGQLDPGLAMVSDGELTSTGAPGSQGAMNRAGGETVTYTDFFGFMGQEHRVSTTSGRVSGDGEWTGFGESSGFSGPTIPILQNARPTQTGAGQGHVRGAGRGL